MLRPLERVFRIGGEPKSWSGPSSSGQFSGWLFGPHAASQTSFSVSWTAHSIFPVSRSNATMESVVFAAGSAYASPVPTYNARRLGSIVGEFQTPAPAGAHRCTPLVFFLTGFGSSGIMYVFQICVPFVASNATTLPRKVQQP